MLPPPSIPRRSFLKTMTLGAATLATSGGATALRGAPATPAANTNGAPRRNVLFLMTDQQRWDLLGVLNPHVKTPHLDRLARRGVVFDQAVCQSPMCIPSRYSLTTGLYCSQIGVRNNAQSIQDSRNLPYPTLFQRFASAGYRTIGAGKTHWTIAPDASRGVRPVVPSTFGFQERYIARLPGGHDREPGAVYFGDANESPQRMREIREWNLAAGSGGEGAPGYLGRTLPGDGSDLREHWLTTKAIDAVERARQRAEPWFCYLSFDAPHAPLYVPEEYERLYELDALPDVPLPPDRATLTEHFPNLTHTEEALQAWLALTPRERKRTLLRYYALMSYADAQFGRMLDYLERSGQWENTVIVFTSDHGDSMGERYRFSKYSLYEGSVRVPLILAGPDVPSEQRGRRDSRNAELVDLVPTLLASCGLPVPQELPGELLFRSSERSGAFSEMHGNGSDHVQRAPAYLWRTPEWKLILYYEANLVEARRHPEKLRGELYQLSTDPQEWRNRFDDPTVRDVRERMTQQMLMHLAFAWAGHPRFDSVGGVR